MAPIIYLGKDSILCLLEQSLMPHLKFCLGSIQHHFFSFCISVSDNSYSKLGRKERRTKGDIFDSLLIKNCKQKCRSDKPGCSIYYGRVISHVLPCPDKLCNFDMTLQFKSNLNHPCKLVNKYFLIRRLNLICILSIFTYIFIISNFKPQFSLPFLLSNFGNIIIVAFQNKILIFSYIFIQKFGANYILWA